MRKIVLFLLLFIQYSCMSDKKIINIYINDLKSNNESIKLNINKKYFIKEYKKRENNINLNHFKNSNDTIFLFYSETYSTYFYQFVYKDINKSFSFEKITGLETQIHYYNDNMINNNDINCFKNQQFDSLNYHIKTDGEKIVNKYFICTIFTSINKDLKLKEYIFIPKNSEPIIDSIK